MGLNNKQTSIFLLKTITTIGIVLAVVFVPTFLYGQGLVIRPLVLID